MYFEILVKCSTNENVFSDINIDFNGFLNDVLHASSFPTITMTRTQPGTTVAKVNIV